MNKNIAKIRVRYAHTEHFGIVYYGKYLEWFEIGRAEILRDNGIIYADFEKNGLYAPVVRVEVDYIGSAAYDDVIELETRIEKIGNSSVTFSHEIRNKDGKTITKATTVCVFITKDRKPTKVPQDVRKIVE